MNKLTSLYQIDYSLIIPNIEKHYVITNEMEYISRKFKSRMEKSDIKGIEIKTITILASYYKCNKNDKTVLYIPYTEEELRHGFIGMNLPIILTSDTETLHAKITYQIFSRKFYNRIIKHYPGYTLLANKDQIYLDKSIL